MEWQCRWQAKAQARGARLVGRYAAVQMHGERNRSRSARIVDEQYFRFIQRSGLVARLRDVREGQRDRFNDGLAP
jgi:hypothetical protein